MLKTAKRAMTVYKTPRFSYAQDLYVLADLYCLTFLIAYHIIYKQVVTEFGNPCVLGPPMEIGFIRGPKILLILLCILRQLLGNGHSIIGIHRINLFLYCLLRID